MAANVRMGGEGKLEPRTLSTSKMGSERVAERVRDPPRTLTARYRKWFGKAPRKALLFRNCPLPISVGARFRFSVTGR